MQSAQKKPWVGAGRFDPINSTYKHIITLDTKKKGIIEMPGYSKGLTEVEPYDKTVVLERMILRLVKEGYLFGKTKKYGDPTLKWDYYLNGTYTGIPDELIFTLYPDEYVFAKNQDFVQNVRLNTFLKRLYSQKQTGEFVTKSLSHKPALVTQEELFNLSKNRFKNEVELLSWVQDRIRDGHAHGLCFRYYSDYCDKWFSNN